MLHRDDLLEAKKMVLKKGIKKIEPSYLIKIILELIPMYESKKVLSHLPQMIILLFNIFFYLPIFQNPNILINRGNDLTQFFWPIFYFVKNNILHLHQIPLWNNLFFSGTPLLPDPQSPIFYLPNILFLIFKKIDTGFVVSIFLHIFIGGIGMYFLAKKSFNFSKISSLFCSFLYIASPKLAGYLEAGHYGLITSWGWLPFIFLFTILVTRKPNIRNITFLSFFLALIFYSHILIFAISVISISLLYFYFKKNPIPLLFAGVICFGFIAISLIPQLSWQEQTTRNLLLNNPDVYPKWLGFKEFIKASVSPILLGSKFIWELDTEKIIGLGLLTSLFSFFGFLKLKLKSKIIMVIIILTIFLISLNNISPFYSLLIKQNWYILLRVATRFWFLITFISILLAGYGFDILLKRKNLRFLIYVLAFLAITELLLTSWTKILKPIKESDNQASIEVYKFLSGDKSQFRVFCLDRCLSQKESAIYGLELADGYGTLQQMNYYIYSEQLSQSFYRNRYTLSIPPFEIFEYEKLQPYSPNLGSYNIKYVISNHVLYDKNLKLIKQIGKYLIYGNKINLERSNYKISFYSPNFIQVDTSNHKNNLVVLSEVYNKDWQAYANGEKEIPIIETVDATRSVKINDDTKFVDFVYQPKSFLIGLIITLFTIFSLVTLSIITSKVSKRTPKHKDS